MRLVILIIFCSLFFTSSLQAELNFAISSMISPDETFYLYKDFGKYIEGKIGKKVNPIFRRNYSEVNKLIETGRVDFASICTGALIYLDNKRYVILGVPVVNGKSAYKSFIIVNKKSNIEKLSDLKGKVFAFTDRLSNSGYIYPRYLILKEVGVKPDVFFKKIFFTNSHDKSIYLVNIGLIDGAAVDSLVFDFIEHHEPEKIKNVKIIHKSEDFLAPPFVASAYLSKDLRNKIQNVLLTMHKDPNGKRILEKLKIDKFVEPDYNLLKKVLIMKNYLTKLGYEE